MYDEQKEALIWICIMLVSWFIYYYTTKIQPYKGLSKDQIDARKKREAKEKEDAFFDCIPKFSEEHMRYEAWRLGNYRWRPGEGGRHY